MLAGARQLSNMLQPLSSLRHSVLSPKDCRGRPLPNGPSCRQTTKAMTFTLTINGHTVRCRGRSADTPLLWVLRDSLDLVGTKFGCGGGFCGACTVHVDGVATRACPMPVGKIAGRPRSPPSRACRRNGDCIPCSGPGSEIDVPQCGYCQAGQIMSCAALLARTPNPTDEEIASAMNGNLCRCGTYVRIKRRGQARRDAEELAMRSRRDVLRDAKTGSSTSTEAGATRHIATDRSSLSALRRPADCWSRCGLSRSGADADAGADRPLGFPDRLHPDRSRRSRR